MTIKSKVVSKKLAQSTTGQVITTKPIDESEIRMAKRVNESALTMEGNVRID